MAAFVLSLFVVFEYTFSKAVNANAATTVAYEQTNVMDDLSGMTINGIPFSVENYGYDEKRDIQVLSFVEYGYSLQEDKQDDYALYIYIYNPKLCTVNTSIWKRKRRNN